MSNNKSEPQNSRAKEDAEIEQQFLKGTKDPELGVHSNLFSARCNFRGQDGGVVTALLIKGLREGLFDAAIVVKRMEGYTAEAAVAQTSEEIEEAKGSKYLKVNVAKKAKELIKQGKTRLAVVCTPCEGRVMRKIQQALEDKAEIVIVGLFCFETFNANQLREQIKMRLNVDVNSAEKTEIRQGKFTMQVEGKEYACKVKELDCAAEKACGFCGDFVSRFADISVGSAGSKRGFSTVIVRSDVGEKLIKGLDCTLESVDKEDIAKLVRFKAERAKKAFAALQNPDMQRV
ncbi:MAG: Coenzyme F420 hydrogenase/dehydrogenase, beta subunit C-terminal domain [Candidatus Bathyarchaeota archaeon]|nr:Coenzyme F420 hydrogenase/dehydrogenase, beta subunit C-terminal domain [Candidatus Bathyarchaeota archaeon]